MTFIAVTLRTMTSRPNLWYTALCTQRLNTGSGSCILKDHTHNCEKGRKLDEQGACKSSRGWTPSHKLALFSHVTPSPAGWQVAYTSVWGRWLVCCRLRSPDRPCSPWTVSKFRSVSVQFRCCWRRRILREWTATSYRPLVSRQHPLSTFAINIIYTQAINRFGNYYPPQSLYCSYVGIHASWRWLQDCNHTIIPYLTCDATSPLLLYNL